VSSDLEKKGRSVEVKPDSYFCAACCKTAQVSYEEAADPRARCGRCGALAPIAERTLAALLRLVDEVPVLPQPAPDSDLMSYEQAAAELGCSVAHVRKLRRKGKLKGPEKVGRNPRLFRESVEALGRAKKGATGDAPARPRRKAKPEEPSGPEEIGKSIRNLSV
jgi:excisionase family DNA binding protein